MRALALEARDGVDEERVRPPGDVTDDVVEAARDALRDRVEVAGPLERSPRDVVATERPEARAAREVRRGEAVVDGERALVRPERARAVARGGEAVSLGHRGVERG